MQASFRAHFPSRILVVGLGAQSAQSLGSHGNVENENLYLGLHDRVDSAEEAEIWRSVRNDTLRTLGL
jgi:hypothetical protein